MAKKNEKSKVKFIGTPPTGEQLMHLLISLLAEQEGVEIKYTLARKEDNES